MARRKPSFDDGRTLFDSLEPLTLPPREETDFLSSDDFITKTREALGKLSVLSNACLDLSLENRAPRHDLAEYLVKMSRAINLSIISHQAIMEKDTPLEGSDININFIKKTATTPTQNT